MVLTTREEAHVAKGIRGVDWLWGGAILAGIAFPVTLFITAKAEVAAAAFVVVIGAALLAFFAGTRAILSAVLLFLVAPGVLGETSFIVSASGITALAVVALTYKRTTPSSFGNEALVLAFLLLPAVAMIWVYGAPVAVVFAVGAFVAWLSLSRPRFAIDALWGLTWILGLFCASFVITSLMGDIGASAIPFPVGGRTLSLNFPFTVTAGGEPFIPGTRRLSPMVGEPGLLGLFLAPLIALIFARKISGRRRVAVALITTLATTFSQSAANVLAVGFALALGTVVVLWLHRRFLVAVALTATAAVIVPIAAISALGEKATVAAASFTDRGIADLGSGSAAMYGNINLLITMRNDPLLAILLIAGIACGLLLAVKTLGGTLSVVAFAIIAIVAQPTQWHPGGWLLVALAVIAAKALQRAPMTLGLSTSETS